MEVQVKGPVSAIEKAFHVSMMSYQHPSENRTFFAPDREPTTNLGFSLWHISGLDNYSIPHPLFVKKSDYAMSRGIDANAVVSHATTGSGPSASFLGSDMRAAYYGGTALTGAGQNLGLFEYRRHRSGRLDHLLHERETDQQRSHHSALHRRDEHRLPGYPEGRQLRRHRADAGHDPGARHGAGAGKPGGVHRFHRHRHHQRDDDAQPTANHHRLFVGLDAGRPNHA